ncbi:hypothetical protein [Streptomyces aurantiacus]|uniref:hypothetical protein n=1 Tax=Streptomyces aurantiacus TaxID=47760 RepID=UPI0006E175A8|nr:hypothetical protein [Streptomyces aurantiacus]
MSLRRSSTRSRTLAAVGFLAAAGLFLTACGPEDSATGAASSDPSVSSSASASASATGSATPGEAGEGKGGNGAFAGALTYLAPGKLMVGEQAFFVAEDTEITGAGFCGDPETPGAEKCTVEQLEAAAKEGNREAEVEMKKGIATKVFAPEAGGGEATKAPAVGDGTVTGTLTYLAPGKLMVGDSRVFWVGLSTKITGGDICGDPEAQEAESCTAEELDEAAKAGNLKVTVTITEGIAESVIQA